MTDRPLISIGALSRASGVPVSTLRTWERRYGHPVAERTPSGHRRYRLDAVPGLRLVLQAVQAGLRPSTVVGLSEDTLRSMLLDVGSVAAPPPAAPAVPATPATPATKAPPAATDAWLELLRQADGGALLDIWQQAWNRVGAERFLLQQVAPFVVQLGESWARAELTVDQEHLASELLTSFLSSQRRSMRGSGRLVLCATLPGERHTLGLQMAATVLANRGWQVIFLGAETPLEDLARAARRWDARAVALSLSKAADLDVAYDLLGALRASLPRPIDLVVGGSVPSRPLDGVRWIPRLEGLGQWATEAAEGPLAQS